MKAERLWEALGEVGDSYIEEILEQTEKRKIKMRKGRLWKPAAAAVLLLSCLLTGIPLLAAEIPAFYQVLYQISPATAQFFIPVQKAGEDNGIRMEVEAAYIEGDTARIYISMQDLEGERIDETTDLFDSYSIQRSFDSVGSCRRVSFEEETGKATFLVEITRIDGKPIEGGKITFSVREFISGKTASEDMLLDLDPASLADRSVTETVKEPRITGFSYPGDVSDDEERKILSQAVLQPQETLYSPIDKIDITAAGYLDGMLHIQLAVTDKLLLDPHGFLYLTDEEGNRVDSRYTISFMEEKEGGKRVDYQEFLFRIPRKELEGCRLYGSFYTAGRNVRGYWRVTFSL